MVKLRLLVAQATPNLAVIFLEALIVHLTKTYEDRFGLTVEADVLFPSFKKRTDTFDRRFMTSSLFGCTTVGTSSTALLGTNTTWLTASTPASSSVDYTNFQVLAIRDAEYSKNIYFKLTSSNDPWLFPTLTSSNFFEAYDNSEWNISVRIKPSNYPLTEVVSGSEYPGAAPD